MWWLVGVGQGDQAVQSLSHRERRSGSVGERGRAAEEQVMGSGRCQSEQGSKDEAIWGVPAVKRVGG